LPAAGTRQLHRLGQSDSVLVQYLVIAGSVDEKILAPGMRKIRLIEEIVESQTLSQWGEISVVR
jgi:SNF2 family DNA or RNA helicase